LEEMILTCFENSTAQAIESCCDVLLWLVPPLDKYKVVADERSADTLLELAERMEMKSLSLLLE